MGDRVHWAVLDSGCTKHPHFNTYDTIATRWDCTKLSHAPLHDGERGDRGDTTDNFCHGTHVAGIIAGAFDFPLKKNSPQRRISGIAPLAKLHIYKVLNDKGEGDDAWIIKALDHIASINEKAGGPHIAGVNLSLGGEFEQGVFGCGHTPLCEELRRLWQQGWGFDWIYERAFLAALPPELWSEWARQYAALLRRGGEIAGYFFLDTHAPQVRRGPPFVTARDELESLLAPYFDCLADEPIVVGDSLPVFAGRERWMVWRKR